MSMSRRRFCGLSLFGAVTAPFWVPFAHPAEAQPTSTLEQARAWLIDQINGGMIGGPITTDWSAQAFSAAAARIGLPPPELIVCNEMACLEPPSKLVRATERTILARLALNLPVNEDLIQFLVGELEAEIVPSHERYPLVPTKTFGILALIALERDLGISHQELVDNLQAVLADLQNDDGGWPLAYNGTASSISDITAEAVLAGLSDNGWLANHQNGDGGIAYGGPFTFSNADSTAWLVLAQPENSTAQDFIELCQNPAGYFQQTPDQDWPTDEQQFLATANCLIALCSVGFPVPPYVDPSSIADLPANGQTRLACNPSPFTRQTSIIFFLPNHSQYRIEIYDLSGRLVWSRSDSGSGRQQFSWSGTNKSSQPVSAGVYFVRLHAHDGLLGQRVIKLR